MEKNARSTANGGATEENIMAMLDSTGIKESIDIHDDRLAFLEAVRAASLVSDCGTVPSCKMFEAIFDILKDTTSLELIMISYQLLIELNKRFPNVHVSHSDTSDSSTSRTTRSVTVEDAWSPFSLGTVGAYNETETRHSNSDNRVDSLGFSQLTENIARGFDEEISQVPEMKLIRNIMLFQYLMMVVERDFMSRYTLYKETNNWFLLKESILNMLLGSKKISYKGLMKDCVSIISKECYNLGGVGLNNTENLDGSSGKTVHSSDVALGTSYFELKKGTYMAMQKFLCLIMELDIIKKQADTQGLTSRADGVRTPLMEIILDEITYDEELFSQFLQVFDDPKWKLEIILQCFSKYLTKPSTRTRRSSNSSEDTTLDGVLSCFSSDASTKRLIKNISTPIVQLLLAHAFQAYLKLRNHSEIRADVTENVKGSSVVQLSRDTIAAFHNLRRADKRMEMLPIGKEALFTAAAIISMKS